MINTICWNVRGVGKHEKLRNLKSLVSYHKVDLCAILEPKSRMDKINMVARNLGFSDYLQGTPVNNHIWIFFNQPLAVDIIQVSSQHITCLVYHSDSEVKSFVTFVYASTKMGERMQLWESLSEEGISIDIPWIILGDFNAITHEEEKYGGRNFGSKSSSDFINFIISNGLLDAGFNGNKFTWSNNRSGLNRIWMRLDRVLYNGFAAASFPALKVTHLPREYSDHCPILASFCSREVNFSFFSFNPAWISHKDFLEVVKRQWDGKLNPDPLVNCHLKLKKLRSYLRSWNWSVFGDFDKGIKELRKGIEAAEGNLQQRWSIEGEKDLTFLRTRLNTILNDQHVFLAAKSHIKWVMDGDRNTKFFHAASKVRRIANNFKVTLEDGSVTDDRNEIGKQAISFFQDLIGGFSNPVDISYFDNIRPIVTAAENADLGKCPDGDEIWEAVKSLPKDSAPGPDGFTGLFFQKCWDVIGQDISEGISHFFKGFSLPRAISSTVMILIPKVKNATTLDQVRPISLCNFMHKIISKILNDRIRPILGRIISDEQFGFIPGRAIHQCIALAHDLTADVNKKVHGGNLMVKLDMSKAYDRVSWHFLIRSMRALGFDERWCDLIYRNLSNCWYSIRIKGKLFGNFKSNRGLRQGDPLSPTLFVLAMEILSRKLNLAGRPGGGVMPYWTSLRAKEINHILFADDILIFSNGARSSFRNLLKVLSAYCSNSGQILQPNKTKIFFSKHICSRKQEDLKAISGFSSGQFPVKYLGAPLFSGSAKIAFFRNIMDNIQDRIAGWMKGFLSFAGRLTMIKSVLLSIPVHSLAALPVPKGVIASIEKILRSFLWSNGSLTRHHWVSWTKVCLAQDAGGLGIRPLSQTLCGLRGKLAWNYLKNNSLWATNARSRFKINRKGSQLWGIISPYISSIALDCQWLIGTGRTQVSTFCQNIAMDFPKSLENKMIRDVIANPLLRQTLLRNANPRLLLSIRGDFCEDKEDLLIWTRSNSGTVTTTAFIDSYVQKCRKIGRFQVIWQPWIPMKISCFVWKILWRAVPTDARIRSIGIPIMSKCVCCKAPTEESDEHLFFRSDMAILVWDFLSPLFNRNRPTDAKALLYDWGVSSKLQSFTDCLAFGLACCALWEIWNTRCNRIFGKPDIPFNKGNILRWAGTLSNFIGLPCASDLGKIRMCEALNIVPPLGKEFKVAWSPWRPHSSGITCNIAIQINGASSSMAAILRDRRGHLILAIKRVSTNKIWIKCLLQILSESRRSGNTLACIKSASGEFCSLGKDAVLDWSSFLIKRKVVNWCREVEVYRVCPALNRPADALCFDKGGPLTTDKLSDLPLAVILSLRNDSCLLPCSFPDQRIFM